MNIAKSFFAGLVIATAAPVLATIINFDDLNYSDQAIPGYPSSYSGLYWANVYVYNATDNPENLTSGYQYSVISPKNVAFNGSGSSITISSNTPFTLNSAYLTSVWRDNLQVEVIGSLLGTPIYDQTFILSATANMLEPFNYVGVDSVEFIPSGGTFHDGYKFDAGPYFAMDDVNIDLVQLFAVPEPGTWLAAALALGVIGFSQRKRVRARARFIKGCASRTVSNN
jgi:hypothetical protein